LERLLKVRDSFNEESQLFFDDSVTLSVEVTKICGKDMVSGHVPLVQEAEAKITGDIDTFLKHPIDQLTVFIERAKNIKAQISMK
jgi:iron uptake system EfeUOB component EfeO/EfeM